MRYKGHKIEAVCGLFWSAYVLDEKGKAIFKSKLSYVFKESAIRDCKNYIDENLTEHSLDKMLTKSYGKKGSLKREKAEERINAIANNLVIHNSLKGLRESKNKSQSTVSKIMKVDASVVSKLESNFKKAQIDTLVRYAKALKVKGVSIVFDFGKEDKHILKLKI